MIKILKKNFSMDVLYKSSGHGVWAQFGITVSYYISQVDKECEPSLGSQIPII